ncbi:TPA_exp: putative leucine aminopeptidase 2 LAP2 [Trichophyton benhamiae CBS 112371]|uniref:Probable leucine aminopeptidase 2 n=1 Tax=Arthroderma benhamiae (strain ATCC MYA-4681 / CBS 112371) TaxID=663331 RepID=LAP2_ARTBC|nr:aminopeptidase, putative [Trichophyton benhamiae CBS 112371]D4AWC9.1 RecName: Full=Probable leucine aminopeptidase 2; AltName: Full=Leucyl aminopeptidase 2; Short=LAP2; Flags: Precursor [Trichophyton benhamiae CBS 112371]EFE32669.1 aminopeptidase, putative [Trichophyton benhamiae CBS 112371]DAA75751.1 TPA_exp: putative leucine aminopeptidase 2 LAP2 [Trichophyton benhamiae CBS 112371]
MKSQLLSLAVAVTTISQGVVGQEPFGWPFKPMVTQDDLQNKIKLKDIMAGVEKLQSFSDAHPEKNRVFGGNGHKDTVEWIYNEIKATGYYDVKKQEQVHLWSHAEAAVSANGKELKASAMSYSPPASKIMAELVVAKNNGCNATDYPENTQGKIVLVERGVCSFGEKSSQAGDAKAAGAIVYNNVPGSLAGTLGGLDKRHVPTAGLSQEDGKNLATLIASGKVDVTMNVISLFENRTTWNVIAETKGGDHNNVVMLGAHSDSVDAGPGINDNGSGSIGIMTVAKALTNFKLNNAVRFAWWTAEEFGLLGSTFYVNSLDDRELHKVKLYLNFDMIGSPNFANQIYDGDGSAYNMTGPAGSAEIEYLFEKFFDDQGIPHQPTAFTGRSDYSAFIKRNVPAGGLFTGAEVVKTPEQVKLFGGEAGVAYDKNYHGKGDTVANINKGAIFLNTRAIAYAIAEYARSLKGFPTRPKTGKRDVNPQYSKMPGGGCGHHTVFM